MLAPAPAPVICTEFIDGVDWTPATIVMLPPEDEVELVLMGIADPPVVLMFPFATKVRLVPDC